MSQTDPVVETIDGNEYSVFMLDPKVSLLLLRRIMAVVSPSMGAMAGGGTGDNSALLSQIASSLFDRLDEKLLEDVLARMSAVTIVDGKKLEQCLQTHFRGRIGHMVKWLAFALRVNYADFLSEFRLAISRVGELRAATTAASQSQAA